MRSIINYISLVYFQFFMIVMGTESRIYIKYINLDDDHSIITPVSCMIDIFNLNVELRKKIPLILTSHTFEHRFFIDHFLFFIRR